MKNREGVEFKNAVNRVVKHTTRNTDMSPIWNCLSLFLKSLSKYYKLVPSYENIPPDLRIWLMALVWFGEYICCFLSAIASACR